MVMWKALPESVQMVMWKYPECQVGQPQPLDFGSCVHFFWLTPCFIFPCYEYWLLFAFLVSHLFCFSTLTFILYIFLSFWYIHLGTQWPSFIPYPGTNLLHHFPFLTNFLLLKWYFAWWQFRDVCGRLGGGVNFEIQDSYMLWTLCSGRWAPFLLHRL